MCDPRRHRSGGPRPPSPIGGGRWIAGRRHHRGGRHQHPWIDGKEHDVGQCRSSGHYRVSLVAIGPRAGRPAKAPAVAKNQSAATVDSTAALQALFNGLQPGQTLTLAPGVYQHSGVLTISVPNVQINGNGATLVATNDATSALEITGNGDSVTNLNLQAPLTGPRYGLVDQNSVDVLANNVLLSNVTIIGSAAVGVFVDGAAGFTLNKITVAQTRADGILITGGSNNGVVNNAITKATQDNGISVVSYGAGYFDGADPQPSHDIAINSPTVDGTTWGHGIAVIGGNNITATNVTVSRTYDAGIYVAVEGSPWYTDSDGNINITGGTVTGADTGPVNGAVLVYAGYANSSINNVTISGLTITGTPSTALRNVEIIQDAGSLSGIAINNIALKNTTLVPLYVGSDVATVNVPAGSYSASGWTLNGKHIAVA